MRIPSRLRIAQLSPLWSPVPPRSYGGTERVVHLLTEELREHLRSRYPTLLCHDRVVAFDLTRRPGTARGEAATTGTRRR